MVETVTLPRNKMRTFLWYQEQVSQLWVGRGRGEGLGTWDRTGESWVSAPNVGTKPGLRWGHSSAARDLQGYQSISENNYLPVCHLHKKTGHIHLSPHWVETENELVAKQEGWQRQLGTPCTKSVWELRWLWDDWNVHLCFRFPFGDGGSADGGKQRRWRPIWAEGKNWEEGPDGTIRDPGSSTCFHAWPDLSRSSAPRINLTFVVQKGNMEEKPWRTLPPQTRCSMRCPLSNPLGASGTIWGLHLQAHGLPRWLSW